MRTFVWRSIITTEVLSELRNPNHSVSSYTPDEHGGWLMDPAPRDPEDFHKIWTTSGSADTRERRTLYEFADEDKYRKGGNVLYKSLAIKCIEITFPGTPTKNHSLELAFTGSANVVLNGSFFYYNQVGV